MLIFEKIKFRPPALYYCSFPSNKISNKKRAETDRSNPFNLSNKSKYPFFKTYALSSTPSSFPTFSKAAIALSS